MAEAPYAYEGLDRVFHERARLGIVTSLAGHVDGLGFSELKGLCGLTDGNLNRHLQVLEEAGFVALDKGYEGKRPLTVCRLTERGRKGFAAYIEVLSDVVRLAEATRISPKASPKGRTQTV
jgi:DNA-binding MarR family transcriptional regulator